MLAYGWLGITAADVPNFSNATGIKSQMQSQFSYAPCEMAWDSAENAAVIDSKSLACSDISAAAPVIRAMSVAPVVKSTCEPGFLVTMTVTTTHETADEATTFGQATPARVASFNGATYFKDRSSNEDTAQTASTTVSARPARPACAVPATDDSVPATDDSAPSGASTWTTVAAALVLAATV